MEQQYELDNFIADRITRLELVNARKSKNLTQKDIHDITGLSMSCISSIESETDSSPTLRSMIKYLNAVGMEICFKKKEI